MRETSKKPLPRGAWALGDIKKDFSPEQRLLIGNISLAFNVLEGDVETLFFLITDLHPSLAFEVSTRINGLEGKIEIIAAGLKLLDFEPHDLTQLRIALGDGTGFKGLKKHRDAVVHARILSPILGVGYKVDRRAQFTKVLITVEALQALYEHIEACHNELTDGCTLVSNLKAKENVATFADDPRKELYAEAMTRCLAQFRSHQDRKRSLPQLPQLPSEEEIQADHDAYTQALVRALKNAVSTSLQNEEGRRPAE
jgi:hypothetical protein